jgi:hypothetical protein
MKVIKNKILFKKIFSILLAIVITFVPFLKYGKMAFAQDNGGDNDGTSGGQKDGTSTNAFDLNFELKNPLDGSGVNTIPDFFAKILEVLITIGIPVVAFFIIYAGFLFVTARGDEKQLTTAKTTLLWTVVGAAVLLGSWVLAQAIGATINELK